MSWIDTVLFGYRTIADALADLPARNRVRFVGAEVTDDPANKETVVTIPSSGRRLLSVHSAYDPDPGTGYYDQPITVEIGQVKAGQIVIVSASCKPSDDPGSNIGAVEIGNSPNRSTAWVVASSSDEGGAYGYYDENNSLVIEYRDRLVFEATEDLTLYAWVYFNYRSSSMFDNRITAEVYG